MAEKTLYQRAVDLTASRPSVSLTNLKNHLNCTDAQAKTILRVMREEGLLGEPGQNLGRYPVLSYSGPQHTGAVVNYDEPERSVLPHEVPIEMVLDAQAQQHLKKVMGELVALEERQATINDERRLIMEFAKLSGMAPKILKKVASAIFRDKTRELLNGADLTQLYLHTLGELVDDDPQGAGPGEVIH